MPSNSLRLPATPQLDGHRKERIDAGTPGAWETLRFSWLADFWLSWGVVAVAHLLFVNATAEPLLPGGSPWALAVWSILYLMLFYGSLAAFVAGLVLAPSNRPPACFYSARCFVVAISGSFAFGASMT